MKLHQRPRKRSLLIIGLGGVSLLVIYTIFIAPNTVLTHVGFFLLFSTTLFYILSFIFNHVRRSTLATLGITLYFILRVIGLHEWLYPFLIFLLVVFIEMSYAKEK